MTFPVVRRKSAVRKLLAILLTLSLASPAGFSEIVCALGAGPCAAHSAAIALAPCHSPSAADIDTATLRSRAACDCEIEPATPSLFEKSFRLSVTIETVFSSPSELISGANPVANSRYFTLAPSQASPLYLRTSRLLI